MLHINKKIKFKDSLMLITRGGENISTDLSSVDSSGRGWCLVGHDVIFRRHFLFTNKYRWINIIPMNEAKAKEIHTMLTLDAIAKLKSLLQDWARLQTELTQVHCHQGKGKFHSIWQCWHKRVNHWLFPLILSCLISKEIVPLLCQLK